jgi:phage tail-like protein
MPYDLELPALYVDNAATHVATSRPVLVNRDPGPGEEGVPLDARLAFELVDPGPDGIDRSATRIWIDDALAFDGSRSPELAPAYTGPRSRVTHDADTLRIVLDPAAPFQSEAVVRVRVASAVHGGAGVIDEAYTFRVEDRTAPRVVAAQAVEPRTVRIAFDEDVVVTDPAAFVLRALAAPAVPVAATSSIAHGPVVTVHLDTEMTPDVRYEVRAPGIADLAGNAPLRPHDTATFTGFRPPRPPERRFDLWSMLPKHNRRADATGDLRRLIACFQNLTDLLLADIDRSPDVVDIERAPEPFVDLILQDLGNPFRFELDALGKRRLAAMLVDMYREKGTAAGIRNAIRFFLGIEVAAIRTFTGATLVLGESQLGVDWELGPSNSFALYAFDVVVGRVLNDVERRQIRAIVDAIKPAHTHFVALTEPSSPPTPQHWELGLSEVGETTILH